LRQELPGSFDAIEAEELYRRLNAVHPSLIRVEADEVTYSLHVIVRYELELELFEGRLEPQDLPQRWNELMERYLGVEVTSDALGVLQDVHWSFGAFGYFPTYALGNLIAAQMWRRLRRDVPELDAAVGVGDFAPLRAWLEQRVHRYGRMLTPAQTLKEATGEELGTGAYLDYLWDKHADVHGVERS
jgi:carboxypeptidase Taq